MAKRTFTHGQELERLLTTEYRVPLWCKFTKAAKTYELIQPGDHICCCISGGKDSMVMALLLKHLQRYSDFPFEVTYLVMNPGYEEEHLNLIKSNLEKMEIPARIVSTDIFQIAYMQTRSPCYLCAKMRRGALYRIAKMWGCNKIALGHHYDDVIETTLMNMLNAGSFQTMLPKLPSTHYKGMEVIRPMYLIREADIIAFGKTADIQFIRCACRFTKGHEDGTLTSQRQATKELIAKLKDTYNPRVEKNIFAAAGNVELGKILGYVSEGEEHTFLEDYENKKNLQNEMIEATSAEEMAIEKAIKEHRDFVVDDTFLERFGH